MVLSSTGPICSSQIRYKNRRGLTASIFRLRKEGTDWGWGTLGAGGLHVIRTAPWKSVIEIPQKRPKIFPELTNNYEVLLSRAASSKVVDEFVDSYSSQANT